MVAAKNMDAAANSKKYTKSLSHLFLSIFIKFFILSQKMM